jgi:hypothetical protein
MTENLLKDHIEKFPYCFQSFLQEYGELEAANNGQEILYPEYMIEEYLRWFLRKKNYKEIEEKIKELEAQLKKAEDVIEFYADGDNWGHINADTAVYSVIQNDLGVGDFDLNDIVDDDGVGGLLAREYFKNKEQKNER